MKTRCATLLLLSAMSTPVMAATISYSQTLDSPRSGYTDSSSPFEISAEFRTSYSTHFSQFHPALGTLNSVTITVNTFMDDGTTGSITNNAAVAATGQFTLAVDAWGTFPGINFFNSASESGAFSIAAGASAPLAPFNGQAAVTKTFTIPGDLSSYIGAGTFQGTVDLANVYTLTPSSGFDADDLEVDLFSSVSTKFEVTYDYTPVPEPTSMALLALGCIGLLRRR